MNQVTKILENLVNFFKAPKAISWQTLMFLSMFSGTFALFAYLLPDRAGIVTANVSGNFALIFLIIGIFWFFTEKRTRIFNIKVRPIVVGLLISVFLFKNFADNLFFAVGQFAPIICGIIAIIPDIYQQIKLRKPDLEKIQQLISIFFVYLLISCWFTFYLFIQNWSKANYPENFYIGQNFSQSIFVVQLIPTSVNGQNKLLKTPEEILNFFEVYLQNQLDNQAWSRVESYLKLLDSKYLKNQISQLLISKIEDSQWSVRLEVESPEDIGQPNLSQYNLTLWVIWSGSSEDSPTYRLKKTCKVRQRYLNIPSGNPKGVAELICDKTTLIPQENTP
jgi:hypothetical protein